jgi:hypothetical protein
MSTITTKDAQTLFFLNRGYRVLHHWQSRR